MVCVLHFCKDYLQQTKVIKHFTLSYRYICDIAFCSEINVTVPSCRTFYDSCSYRTNWFDVLHN